MKIAREEIIKRLWKSLGIANGIEYFLQARDVLLFDPKKSEIIGTWQR